MNKTKKIILKLRSASGWKTIPAILNGYLLRTEGSIKVAASKSVICLIRVKVAWANLEAAVINGLSLLMRLQLVGAFNSRLIICQYIFLIFPVQSWKTLRRNRINSVRFSKRSFVTTWWMKRFAVIERLNQLKNCDHRPLASCKIPTMTHLHLQAREEAFHWRIMYALSRYFDFVGWMACVCWAWSKSYIFYSEFEKNRKHCYRGFIALDFLIQPADLSTF